MLDVAFVTTCKGRLHHIKRTLPMLVAQSPAEIVVVDYGCPDGVGDWVDMNYPEVTVVRAEDDAGFCVARARNLGARKTTSPWICFIDADVQVMTGWGDWMKKNLDPRFFYRAAKDRGLRENETWGTFLCSRKAFELSDGYDEVFRGWGGEDDDLYRRLNFIGIAESSYPAKFVEPLRHGDEERLAFYDSKERDIHHCVARFYLEAKLQIMLMQSKKHHPPIDVRLKIMNLVNDSVRKWSDDRTQDLPEISFTTNGIGWLPKPYRMLKKVSFTLTMEEWRGPS